MNSHLIPNSTVSKAVLIYLRVEGHKSCDLRDALIAAETGMNREDLSVLGELVRSLTELAIDQIHRTFRGNPPITKEQAREHLRNIAYFLSDEAFDRLFQWAEWCVAKGA